MNPTQAPTPASQSNTPFTPPIASGPTQPGQQPGANVPSNPAAQPKNPNSSQNTLLFQELRDDMVVMGDGTFRAIVAAKSINFDLMSSRERSGIEYSYQQFLNMLNFPIQIYVHSQEVDIGPYLDKLTAVRNEQDNMLLGVLMDDYIQFIDALSQAANIMDKSFFIIIPYGLGDEKSQVGKSSDTGKGLLTNLFTPSKKHQYIKIPADQYQRAKDQTTERTIAVIDGLTQLGVPAVRLKTKELGQLYYNLYNPDTAVRQPIGDFRNFTSTVVKKGEGVAPTPDLNQRIV
jgi:hypothetical protein